MNLKRLFINLSVALLAVSAANASGNDKTFTLVIDAGHGGHDPGAIGTYSKEKNINLNVALEFGRLVEANCPDVKVIYTRKKDVSVNLQERADIANRAKADLFISIHTNALRKGRIAYGAETYTLGMARSDDNLDVAKRENSAILVEENYSERYAKFNPNSSESYIIFEFMQDEYMKQSVSLAKSIQKYYVKIAGRQDKGVHQAGFLVLRETSMPSVLTELGFISTPAEEAYLNSDNGVKKLARSIYEGFLDYKQTQDGKKRVTPPYKNLDDSGTPVPDETNDNKAAQDKSQETKQSANGAAETKGNSKAESTVNKAKAPQQNITDDGIILIGDAAAKQDNKPATLESNATKTQESGTSVLRELVSKQESSKEQAAETRESPAKDVQQSTPAEKATSSVPVFKIQFLTSDSPLNKNDKRLKEANGLESYTEGGITKYTCEPTENYNEAKRKLKEIRAKYSDAFIVAFKGNERMDTGEAIREFLNNKKRP